MDTNIHNAKSIKLEKAKKVSNFYTRDLYITLEGGEKYNITFFSENKGDLEIKNID